jgi:hypothetical protein
LWVNRRLRKNVFQVFSDRRRFRQGKIAMHQRRYALGQREAGIVFCLVFERVEVQRAQFEFDALFAKATKTDMA